MTYYLLFIYFVNYFVMYFVFVALIVGPKLDFLQKGVWRSIIDPSIEPKA